MKWAWRCTSTSTGILNFFLDYELSWACSGLSKFIFSIQLHLMSLAWKPETQTFRLDLGDRCLKYESTPIIREEYCKNVHDEHCSDCLVPFFGCHSAALPKKLLPHSKQSVELSVWKRFKVCAKLGNGWHCIWVPHPHHSHIGSNLLLLSSQGISWRPSAILMFRAQWIGTSRAGSVCSRRQKGWMKKSFWSADTCKPGCSQGSLWNATATTASFQQNLLI